MPEWWSYRLTDFLLFSPETYWRLFELYNAAVWPLQILAAAAALAIFVLIVRLPAPAGRAVPLLLAGAWGFVGWAFFYERYATINWAAIYFAAGFALQAALLVAASFGAWLSFDRAAGARRALALGLLGFGIFVQPLIGPLLGRAWSQLELFGLTPDPTAIATLGALTAASGRGRWLLLPIPLLWCVVGGLTLFALQARA